MNRSIFQKLIKLLILTFFVIATNILCEKYAFCLEPKLSIKSFTYHIHQSEEPQKYTYLGMSLDNYYQLLEEFIAHKHELSARLVEISCPKFGSIKYNYYYTDTFIQFSYPGCEYYLNFPLTKYPQPSDTCIVFEIEYSDNTNITYYITTNAIVKPLKSTYYIDDWSEQILLLQNNFNFKDVLEILYRYI